MPLLIVLLGILLLFLLIAKFKLNAFLSFIIVSLFVGIAGGMDILVVVDSIQKGIGNTLGFLVLIFEDHRIGMSFVIILLIFSFLILGQKNPLLKKL